MDRMLFGLRMEPGTFWLVLGTAGATTLAMFRVAALRRRQQQADRQVAMPQPTATGGPPRGVARWEAELHEFTREVEARLDNKMAVLQQLVVHADERIAKLERLAVAAPLEVPPVATSLAGPHFAEARSRHAAVFAMSDAGHNAAVIANRLSAPIGEIELILTLRRPGT
jgi:hypothetical protein